MIVTGMIGLKLKKEKKHGEQKKKEKKSKKNAMISGNKHEQ